MLRTEAPIFERGYVQKKAPFKFAESAATLRKRNDQIDEGSSHLHLKLEYLNPETKPVPSFIRAGDLKTGRIRPDPVYVSLSRHVFGLNPRRDLLHAAVVYYLDSKRAGTASTKTRGEVAYSGAKIRPQKGSGNARLGGRSNPLLRKGGVIFGPRPRDMSSKLNRRVRELALRSALSSKWKQGLLHVVKDLSWHTPPSTGTLRKMLYSKGWEDCLFLTAPRNPESFEKRTLKPNPKPSSSDPIYTKEQEAEHKKSIYWLDVASRNSARRSLIRLNRLHEYEVDCYNAKPPPPNTPGELHAYHILRRNHVILDLGAVEWLEVKLGGTIFSKEETYQIYNDIRENITDLQIDSMDVKEEGSTLYVNENLYVHPRHMEESYQIIQRVNGKRLPREDEFRFYGRE